MLSPRGRSTPRAPCDSLEVDLGPVSLPLALGLIFPVLNEHIGTRAHSVPGRAPASVPCPQLLSALSCPGGLTCAQSLLVPSVEGPWEEA